MSGRYLILVNKSNPLPRDHEIMLEEIYGSQLEKTAAFMLREMFGEARLCGAELKLLSGYRSPGYQKELFEKSIRQRIENGMSRDEAVADTSVNVACPYESEHNTGLAADIVAPDDDDVFESFEHTKQFRWLCDNADRFGFILRYPKDKTDITGYIYEPWHYRYVGPYDAQIIKRNKLTLEEYLDSLS